ncbi:hemolysin, partial [Candidatus Magnetomorum sp. HK-1]
MNSHTIKNQSKPKFKKRPEKIRLDVLLKQKKLVDSRERARALILAGKVLIDQVPVDKAGTRINTDA